MKSKKTILWLIYLIISIALILLAGGLDYLDTKEIATLNLPVVAIAGVIALFSVFRIILGFIPKKTVVEEEGIDPKDLPEIDVASSETEKDFKICIHCGKAEPLDAVYCSSCGNRFPER
jgi:ribosomal protein L40E